MAAKSQRKDSTHQASRSTSVFQKPNWLAQKQMPSVRMVASAPEEDDYPPPAEQLGCEDRDSGESYVATEEPAISTVEDGVSEGDLEAVFRVT